MLLRRQWCDSVSIAGQIGINTVCVTEGCLNYDQNTRGGEDLLNSTLPVLRSNYLS